MISAVILTKNEEKNIEDCIKSVKWCDEIILIDDNSTDKTREIAEELGAKVFRRDLNGDFFSQRNFGLEKAKNEWVFFVDADERVTPSLCEEIIGLTNNPINQCSGFYIKRRDFTWGKELKHGETGNIWLLRLARKLQGKWEGKIHEEWKIKGKVGKLENSLYHYPHQTVNEFLTEINFYTNLRAKELFEKKVRSGFHPLQIRKAVCSSLHLLTRIQKLCMRQYRSLKSKSWVLTRKNLKNLKSIWSKSEET